MLPLGPLRATIETIGDRLTALCGLTLTRLTAPLLPGQTTAHVAGTHSWPRSGRAIVGGELVGYASRGPTSLVGLTRDPYWIEPHEARSPVVCWTRDRSAVERARLGMLVRSASGVYLDVVGNNVGVPRYLDVPDATYRTLIRVLAFQPGRGTVAAIEQLLTVLLDGTGYAVDDAMVNAAAREVTSVTGGFTARMIGMRVVLGGLAARRCQIVDVPDENTLVLGARDTLHARGTAGLVDEGPIRAEVMPFDILAHDPWQPATVLIWLNVAPPRDPHGFAYFQGGERVTSDDTTHVTVAAPIRQVLGVWLATDPGRVGTNYATANAFSGTTIALQTPLPSSPLSVIVDYGSVPRPGATTTGVPGSSAGPAVGELLADVTVRSPGSPPVLRYPLYLGDRVGALRHILDALTVAGVTPELYVRTW